MTEQYEAIVIKSQDTKEFDKTIYLLTTTGILICTLVGVKKPGAKLKMAALPLSYGEFSLEMPYKRVSGFAMQTDFSALSNDYDAFVLASIACECALISAYLDNDTARLQQGLLYTLNNLLTYLQNTQPEQMIQTLTEFIFFVLAISGYSKQKKYTLRTIIQEFEYIFETELKSAKLLSNL